MSYTLVAMETSTSDPGCHR